MGTCHIEPSRSMSALRMSNQGYSSLYVHFPFCETKCHYCDFYSLAQNRVSTDIQNRFYEALEFEAKLQAPLLSQKLDTVFLGGGTPSMTPPKIMAQVLKPLNLLSRIHSGTEWTMEGNPGSLLLSDLSEYKSLGVNRISMGVQSLRDDLLKKMGRVHSGEEALRALDRVFESGFSNVSVDLLCGVPDLSLRNLEDQVHKLTSFPITHMSIYLLTLGPKHWMAKELPHEDFQAEQLLLIHRLMEEKGFEHYEISNFAKPSKRARHNMNYWQGGSYLGLGPSAHSYDSYAKSRFKNVSALENYSRTLLENQQVPEDSREILTQDQIEIECWMLALRLSDGFPKTWLSTPSKIEKARVLSEHGYIETHPLNFSNFKLTPLGFTVSEQVIRELI